MKINMLSHKKLYLKTLVLAVCIGLCVILISSAWALQPARPGEIEKLKAEGKFESSLQRARENGNHIMSPRLVQSLKQKVLEVRGMSSFDADTLLHAPPPAWQGGLPSTGAPRIFALLIEFQDETATNSAADIDDMLFGDGDNTNFPLESLTDYYDRASYGMLDLSNGVTLGWYQTAYDRSTVVETGAGRENLIKEVINFYDSTGHDFSVYDNDGDGDIEYFIVMWAGPTGAWATFWWGWNLGWADGTYTVDGKTLSNYSWQRESNNPSVVIHETGHSLGLPDLYDYDNTVGPGGGVGGFDPMDGNRWDHNCFNKWMLDWLTPTVVAGSRQDLTLRDTTSTDCVLIWPGIGLGDIFSEFYIVQNRQSTGNDQLGFMPDGLAVWHIDTTLTADGADFVYNNSTTDHKLIRLMEADGLEEIETLPCSSGSTCAFADSGDLYNMGNEINPDTSPSSDKYDGTDSCVRVWDIVDEGADPGAEMTAAFSTVCNQLPVCDANGPYSAECQGATTSLPLDGTGSSDPDAGDIITYAWTTDCPGGSFDDSSIASPILTVSSTAMCTVTLTITDLEGDSDSDSSSVTVSDITDPEITCPSDITIECDASRDPSNTGMAMATDTCDQDLDVTFTDSLMPGACAEEETITRTWTATDDSGNWDSCVQTIEVVDTTPPTIQCNAPVTIMPPDAPISFTATAVDNCAGDPSVEILDYDCYKFTKKGKRIDKTQSCVVELNGGTVTIVDSGGRQNNIIWRVRSSDNCGNASEATCSVTVVNPSRSRNR